MATKDERPSLLSKVALFVRNPTKDWSELDRPSQREEAGYDKQALQAMIERKRQNDFVRRREFDQLRKLRNRDPAAMAGAARPSYFQNSIPATDQDGRAVTLKKIDEIEAQMSKQWWKNKSDNSAPLAPAAHSTIPTTVPQATSAPTALTTAEVFGPTQPYAPTVPPHHSVGSEFVSTQMSDVMRMFGNTEPAPGKPATRAGTLDSAFSVSRLFVNEVDEIATDPELEEAAIRFANGDAAGAEKSLIDALHGDDLAPLSAKSWSAAVLDLYRATNRRADFDRAVQEFSIHLDGAHPVWSNLGVASYGADGKSVQLTGPALWESPAALGSEHMQALQEQMASHDMPWNLNWERLERIEADALPLLSTLFSSLCREPVVANFAGADALMAVLRSCTPADNSALDPAWWDLRLNALCALRQQDAFELAVLDYCVAHHGAAPVWQDVSARIYAIDASDMRDNGPATTPLQYGDGDGLSALRGEILGDATQALSGLLDFHTSGQLLLVGCSELLRVDFAAAGSILNWVAQRQAEGLQVQFHNVHRLIAAFFNVIGINEHARVVPRAI